MAWRPTGNLIDGELGNTVPGRVTGWLRFRGMGETVRLDLTGDFHRDIRGAKIRLKNPCPSERNTNGSPGEARPSSYMDGFSPAQTGEVGDITAGLPPQDYVPYPYVEWFSDENGRVVLELEPDQVEIIGRPIPWQEGEPISRQQQRQNMRCFLAELGQALRAVNPRSRDSDEPDKR